LSKFDIRFCLRLAFCDIWPIRNHELIGFAPKDEQVDILQEVGKVFMGGFIGTLFGVVAAAVQGNVDCEDYIPHLIVLTPEPALIRL
jgi:hypothetical protein